MKALIDSDTPAFSAAITSEDSEEWVALSRLDVNIQSIIDGCGCSEYQLFVSGKGNFRYDIDPSYKAHRPQKDPIHREACRKHLIDRWGAVECNGYEADDAVGCEQTEDTIIVGIDKDLLMIPGKHYQWPIIRGGKEVRSELWHDITFDEGMRIFFEQSLVGDKADNIIGVRGIGKVGAFKILSECSTEEEMYQKCRELYDDDERFHKNLDLLWIWRSYGMTYNLRRECE